MYDHIVYNEFLNDLFPKFPEGATVLEFGVNLAQDTIKMLNMLKSPKYYGFEPDPDHIDIINKVVNGRIHLEKAAISDVTGEKILYQSFLNDGSNPGASSIREPKDVLKEFSHVSFRKGIVVPSWRLDDFAEVHGIENVHFIWADIQGAEIDMIRGGQRVLANTDYLFTEYSNKELYGGQGKLADILRELPGCWEIVKDYKADVLLRRFA